MLVSAICPFNKAQSITSVLSAHLRALCDGLSILYSVYWSQAVTLLSQICECQAKSCCTTQRSDSTENRRRVRMTIKLIKAGFFSHSIWATHSWIQALRDSHTHADTQNNHCDPDELKLSLDLHLNRERMRTDIKQKTSKDNGDKE